MSRPSTEKGRGPKELSFVDGELPNTGSVRGSRLVTAQTRPGPEAGCPQPPSSFWPARYHQALSPAGCVSQAPESERPMEGPGTQREERKARIFLPLSLCLRQPLHLLLGFTSQRQAHSGPSSRQPLGSRTHPLPLSYSPRLTSCGC